MNPSGTKEVVTFVPIQLTSNGDFLFDRGAQYPYLTEKTSLDAEYVGHHQHRDHTGRFKVEDGELVCKVCYHHFPFPEMCVNLGGVRGAAKETISKANRIEDMLRDYPRLVSEVADLRSQLEDLKRQFGVPKAHDVARNRCAGFVHPHREDESETIGGYTAEGVLAEFRLRS